MYDVEGNADAIAVTPTNATNYHIRDYMNGATEATEDNLGWYYTPTYSRKSDIERRSLQGRRQNLRK